MPPSSSIALSLRGRDDRIDGRTQPLANSINRVCLIPSRRKLMSDVTRILSQIESGDPSAAEQLLPLVYDELRKLAATRHRLGAGASSPARVTARRVTDSLCWPLARPRRVARCSDVGQVDGSNRIPISREPA